MFLFFDTPSRATDTSANDEEWREKAHCANDANPDRWVDLPPVRRRGKNNPDYDRQLATLQAVCKGCPVRTNCLNSALKTNVRGVFAGTDEYMRADIREAVGHPEPNRIHAGENEEDQRLLDQQFAALRLARKGFSNTEIARELGVSAMTVSRLTADEEKPSKRRTRRTNDDTAVETCPEAGVTTSVETRFVSDSAPIWSAHEDAEYEAEMGALSPAAPFTDRDAASGAVRAARAARSRNAATKRRKSTSNLLDDSGFDDELLYALTTTRTA